MGQIDSAPSESRYAVTPALSTLCFEASHVCNQIRLLFMTQFAPMHPALGGSILRDVVRSLVLLLLLILGLAPGVEARSQRGASRPRPQSRQRKKEKGKRNRKAPVYDENGRRKN